MLKYTSNTDLKKYIDKLLIDKSCTKVDLAKKLDCKPQQVNNILNKRNLSFADIQRICNALDCDLYIEIRQRDIADSNTDV